MDPIDVAARLGCSPQVVGRLLVDRHLVSVMTDAGAMISSSAFDEFTEDPRIASLRIRAAELALASAAAEQAERDRSTAMQQEVQEHRRALMALVEWARELEIPTEALAVCEIGVTSGVLRRGALVERVADAWVVEGWHVGRAVHQEFDLMLQRELFLTTDAILIAGCRPADRSVLRKLPSTQRRRVRMQVSQNRLDSPTSLDMPANFDALAAWVSRATR
jgi:hypothetical protein